MDDKQLDKLVMYIYECIAYKHWLYWPPGPMTGQVFDRERCKRDLENFFSQIEKI